jgi:hypothetical protein
MKSNAVDCQINQYENEDENLGCITLPGTPQQYAFHPNLMKDIAETSTKFRETELTATAPASASASSIVQEEQQTQSQTNPKQPPLTQAQTKAPTKAIRAYEISVNKTLYLAVPVLSKGQTVPLVFDLYSRGDIRRTKRIGVSIADSQGNPTSDIELF